FSRVKLTEIDTQGAFVLTGQKPELGEPVVLVIGHRVWGHDFPKLEAQVVRVTKNGFGVEFGGTREERRRFCEAIAEA
ncbi:MAG: PilZ domain-containing protein, partial [Myxococcota bacterium]